MNRNARGLTVAALGLLVPAALVVGGGVASGDEGSPSSGGWVVESAFVSADDDSADAPEASEAEKEAARTEFEQCMSDNGVELKGPRWDDEDGERPERGRRERSERPEPPSEEERAKMEAAHEECGDILREVFGERRHPGRGPGILRCDDRQDA